MDISTLGVCDGGDDGDDERLGVHHSDRYN